VRRFAPGEAIALREVWRGRIWAARAAIVVDDREDQTMLFIPAGSPWMAAVRDGVVLRVYEEGFELAPERYDPAFDVLSFAWPDMPYAVLLFWRDGQPHDVYVNLQDPLERTPVGFDTFDHELDAIVERDGTWRWKDEDELAEAIARGVLPPDAEPRLRADGERAVRRIVEREPPFDRDWWAWRPDPSWPMPVLPDRWDTP
jgi:hypothetical protein